MQTGDLNVLGDLCAGGYQMIYNQETAGSTTSINITPIVGQTDREYRLIVYGMNPLAAAQTYLVRPNNNTDATAYGQQNMTGTAAIAAAVRTTGSGIMLHNATVTSANHIFTDMTLKSRSGTIRTALVNSLSELQPGSVNSVNLAGWSWIDTSASITSLMLTGVMGSSNVFLFARKPAGSDSDATGIPTGDLDVQGDFTADVMQKVYENDLTASASSITISGLDGNTDTLYWIIMRVVSENATTEIYYLEPNGDGTLSNYGHQWLYGTNASIGAQRGKTGWYFPVDANGVGTVSLVQSLIYAKVSGGPRMGITGGAMRITGTTIAVTDIFGHTWNNTATNITSIVLYNAGTTGGYGSGSHIELWSLKKST